jgi:hypothetical protein
MECANGSVAVAVAVAVAAMLFSAVATRHEIM